MLLVCILTALTLIPAQSGYPLTKTESVSEENVKQGYTVADSIISHNGREMKSYPKQKALNGIRGEGEFVSSLDVFIVGHGNEAVFEWKGKKIVNGEGTDFKVFENSFYMRGTDKKRMSLDLGLVAVSKDGKEWKQFSVKYDDSRLKNSPQGKEGFIGLEPVYLHWEDNFTDPQTNEAGGDAFDLSDVGIEQGDYIKYVKLIDAGEQYPDGQIGSNGIDIDGVCAFYWITE